jgi:CRP/FNR family transcriptional regulator
MFLGSADQFRQNHCHVPVDCDRCPVRTDAICCALDMGDLSRLHDLGRRVQVKRGQTLAWEGDEAVIVGNVITGILKLSAMTGDGREQIVGLVFPSDFVGRPFGKDNRYSVTALSDATLCIFRRHAFDAFAAAHPGIEQALLRRTLDELDRARRWMLLLGRKTATERVASLLIEMIERLGGTCGETISLPLSRQQMGDLLGLAIETVSRTLTRLRTAGIIGLPPGRKLVVHHPAMLIRLANG